MSDPTQKSEDEETASYFLPKAKKTYHNPKGDDIVVGYHFIKEALREYERGIKARANWGTWIGMFVSSATGAASIWSLKDTSGILGVSYDFLMVLAILSVLGFGKSLFDIWRNWHVNRTSIMNAIAGKATQEELKRLGLD